MVPWLARMTAYSKVMSELASLVIQHFVSHHVQLTLGRETRAHWCWPRRPAKVRTLQDKPERLMAATGHLFEEMMARYSTKMDDFKGSFAYRVFVVGECKPISCGKPTSLQNSLGDNKEFVFPEIAAPPSQPLAWPLASLHPLLSTDFMWSLQ